MCRSWIRDSGRDSWCCPFAAHAMATTQQSPPLPFMWGNYPLASSAQASSTQHIMSMSILPQKFFRIYPFKIRGRIEISFPT